MIQSFGKPDGVSANEASEESTDLDVSDLRDWIDSADFDPMVIEYGLLNMLSRPSEAQQDRIQYILDEAANDDNALGFWITEMNHILGHKQGYLDDDFRKSYECCRMELSKETEKFQRLIDKRDTQATMRFIESYLSKYSKGKNSERDGLINRCVSFFNSLFRSSI